MNNKEIELLKLELELAKLTVSNLKLRIEVMERNLASRNISFEEQIKRGIK